MPFTLLLSRQWHANAIHLNSSLIFVLQRNLRVLVILSVDMNISEFECQFLKFEIFLLQQVFVETVLLLDTSNQNSESKFLLYKLTLYILVTTKNYFEDIFY